MPEISRFFGIVIRMFFRDVGQHKVPHIHAAYAEYDASFSLPSGDLLAGDLPRRQRRMVEAWIEIRREELIEAWGRAIRGQVPGRIDPLS